MNTRQRCLALSLMTAASLAGATDIQAPGPQGPLQGTLLQASPVNRAVALIIPGSGPTDRNGNNPQNLHTDTYRQLAEGLASQGISSVRIDKRGMFGSAAAWPDANAVTMADYAEDIAHWTDRLRQQTGASCVWLIGHSEGGLVALLAAQTNPDVCGVVLLAAPGRPLATLIHEQLAAHPQLQTQADGILARLQAGQHVAPVDIPAPLLPLFHPAVQGFLISAMALDPAKLIHTLGKRVLIVQGTRDLQVSAEDARQLHQANPEAQLQWLDQASHTLKVVAQDDRAGNLQTYTDPSIPLAPQLVPAIARFILQTP